MSADDRRRDTENASNETQIRLKKDIHKRLQDLCFELTGIFRQPISFSDGVKKLLDFYNENKEGYEWKIPE